MEITRDANPLMIRTTLLHCLAAALLVAPLAAQEEAVESLPSAPVSLMPAIPAADSAFERYLLRDAPEDPRLHVRPNIGRSAAHGALAGAAFGLFGTLLACNNGPASGTCVGGGTLLGAMAGGLLGALWAALPRYERPNDPPAATAATCGPTAGCTEPSGAGGA